MIYADLTCPLSPVLSCPVAMMPRESQSEEAATAMPVKGISDRISVPQRDWLHGDLMF